jgi:outer membrane protein TolC
MANARNPSDFVSSYGFPVDSRGKGLLFSSRRDGMSCVGLPRRLLLLASALFAAVPAFAQDAAAPPPRPVVSLAPGTQTPAPPNDTDKPFPINLPTALQLVHANALDVAIASAQIRISAAQLGRAQVLWLPTIQVGTDYFRHDGQIQDAPGNVFGASKSSFMVGAAPIAVFAVTDAVFSPLVARQVMQARQSDLQATTNDITLAVAEAYFNVQQARGELAGAIDASRRAEEVARRTTELAKGLAPPLEVARARSEASRRRQAVQVAYAHWRNASAELVRILRIDPSVLVEPVEPPHLQVNLLSPNQPADDLIPVALVNRPELASQQALVQAALIRMRQERMRPLVPSLLLRGAATNPAGTLSSGYFGGGINGSLTNFSMRNDADLQVLWELQNLGFGNRARIDERRAEHREALLTKLRTQDLVAAEVVRAHADLQSAAARVTDAEEEVRFAVESADKNFEGMTQTKNAGNIVLLVIRPQEVVAAVQALGQAYANYYGAIGDFNRAQFRLYRAMGHPAQAIDPTLTCPAARPSAN